MPDGKMNGTGVKQVGAKARTFIIVNATCDECVDHVDKCLRCVSVERVSD